MSSLTVPLLFWVYLLLQNVLTEPLASSGLLVWLHYSGLQASCHNIYILLIYFKRTWNVLELSKISSNCSLIGVFGCFGGTYCIFSVEVCRFRNYLRYRGSLWGGWSCDPRRGINIRTQPRPIGRRMVVNGPFEGQTCFILPGWK
jgi:hypothetical protein